MAKAPEKTKLELRIEKQERELHALKMEHQINASDNPKEAKALMRAAKILQNLVDTDEDGELSDALIEIVREMCGIEDEDE